MDNETCNISVFGVGYVGLVTGVCLADAGHNVVCVDVDEDKINLLKRGISPIYEKFLPEKLEKALNNGTLEFTTNSERAVNASDIIYIATGTPEKEDGSADLQYVYAVADTIKQYATKDKTVVVKSTVVPGTCRNISERLNKNSIYNFEVISNPEFLREGSSVYDFENPDRIIVGAENTSNAMELAKKLYTVSSCTKLYAMSWESAEITKYASNSLLATKIAFINEVKQLSKRYNASISDISEGMGADHRIGPYFLRAGVGFGGSCFPKDTAALVHIGEKVNVDMKVVKATIESNVANQQFEVEEILKLTKNHNVEVVTVWGTAFKPGTDDVRESPAIKIIEQLSKKLKCKFQIYDPEALENTLKVINIDEQCTIEAHTDKHTSLKNSDMLLILTEWPEFTLPYNALPGLVNDRFIVYNPFESSVITYSLNRQKRA